MKVYDGEYEQAAVTLAGSIFNGTDLAGSDNIDDVEAWCVRELKKLAAGKRCHDEIHQTVEEMRRVVDVYDRARKAH